MTTHLDNNKRRDNTMLPNKLAHWLTASGSLTALLENKAGQPLRVVRTFEGFKPLNLTQKKQIGLTGQALNRPLMAWVREVLLYGDDATPWIAAQSIFPQRSLQGDAKRLKHLKNTPIGYVLFKRQTKLPNMRTITNTTEGWQRQTLYHWQGRPILIAETFLQAFENTL